MGRGLTAMKPVIKKILRFIAEALLNAAAEKVTKKK
jgi:hypothetical protein